MKKIMFLIAGVMNGLIFTLELFKDGFTNITIVSAIMTCFCFYILDDITINEKLDKLMKESD